MTIPGRGDLSPRRRTALPTPGPRTGLAVLALLVVAAVVYVVVASPFSSSSHVGATRACPRSTTTSSTLPSLRSLRVTVRNATLRTGLAADVAGELRQRGVHVPTVGNVGVTQGGTATIRYSADRRRQAAVLATQVTGATLHEVSGGTRVLTLDLGRRWTSLASHDVATQRLDQLRRSSRPTATPTSTGCATPVATSTTGSSS